MWMLFVIGTLFSMSGASSLRITQEISLGEAFFAIATNYTTTNTTSYMTTETKNGHLYADLEASQIGPLATGLDTLCTQQGYVESKSSNGNESVTSSYSLSCRVPVANFGIFEDAVIALLAEAQDQDNTTTYSYTSDSYVSSYASTDAALAQQKALEYLLTEADTIEEVILVFTSWQSVQSSTSAQNPMSSFFINLNQKYIYPTPPPSGLNFNTVFPIGDQPLPPPPGSSPTAKAPLVTTPFAAPPSKAPTSAPTTKAPTAKPTTSPTTTAPILPAPLTSCSIQTFAGECTTTKGCKSKYPLATSCKKNQGGVCFCPENKICGCQ